MNNEMDELQSIADMTSNESFRYAFEDADEIEDPEFQRLRRRYINAYEKLYNYMDERTQIIRQYGVLR